jgi:hypothetical protein
MKRNLLLLLIAVLGVSMASMADDIYRVVLIPAAPCTRIVVAGNGQCTILDGSDVDSPLAAGQMSAQLQRLASLYQEFRVWVVAKTAWDRSDQSEYLEEVLARLDPAWLRGPHYLIAAAPFAFSESVLRAARSLGFQWADLNWEVPFVLEDRGFGAEQRIGIFPYCTPTAVSHGGVCIGEMLSIGHLRILWGNENLSADGAILPDVDIFVSDVEAMRTAVQALWKLRPEVSILVPHDGSDAEADVVDQAAFLLSPMTDAASSWTNRRLIWLGRDLGAFSSLLAVASGGGSGDFAEISTDGDTAFWVDGAHGPMESGSLVERPNHVSIRVVADPIVVDSKGSIGSQIEHGVYIDGIRRASLDLAFGETDAVCIRAYVSEWDKSLPDYGEAVVMVLVPQEGPGSTITLDVRIAETNGPSPGYQVWRFTLEVVREWPTG